MIEDFYDRRGVCPNMERETGIVRNCNAIPVAGHFCFFDRPDREAGEIP